LLKARRHDRSWNAVIIELDSANMDLEVVYDLREVEHNDGIIGIDLG
jgi:hypothetical protein